LHFQAFRVRHPACFIPANPGGIAMSMLLLFAAGLALLGLMAAFVWFCDRV
jgi:hypothetical protein